jgi:hypothetical protein
LAKAVDLFGFGFGNFSKTGRLFLSFGDPAICAGLAVPAEEQSRQRSKSVLTPESTDRERWGTGIGFSKSGNKLANS